MTSQRRRILIVDDSAFFRQTLAKMLGRLAQFEVVGVAGNGVEAISAVSRVRPDMIVLDLQMPEMDGFAFLRWLMQNQPLPVLVLSAEGDSANVFKALQAGAVDFLPKPTRRATSEIFNIEAELFQRMEALSQVPREKLLVRKEPVPPAASLPPLPPSQEKAAIVAIGASTGGPAALQAMLPALPKEFEVPIVVAQHMPPGFTLPFAERLKRLISLDAREAREGDEVLAGCILIAPGGHNMDFESVRDRVFVRLSEPKEGDRYVPSVDQMMTSAAQIYKERTLGVLLTGMGSDGRLGMKTIKRQGGQTLAEAEETAVVFGMPREAIVEGVVDRVVPLWEMAAEIFRRASGGQK